MIRRPIKLDAGADGWILVSQVEHARLAGQLAERWAIEPARQLQLVQKELLTAIFHHDDGWTTWEQRPKIDATTGQPLDFTEIKLADSLDIWRRSIAVGESIGYLSAHVIAGHFLFLLARSDAWTTDDADGLLARSWATEFRTKQAEWLAEWQLEPDKIDLPGLAETALNHLQILDALSLWFCCAERTDPNEITLSTGVKLTFTPTTPYEVHVAPWPFAVNGLRISIGGDLVDQQRFDSTEELNAARKQAATLAWRLFP